MHLGLRKICIKKQGPQSRFSINQNAPQARPVKQNAPQARFFDKSQWVLCPIDIVCNLHLTNHSSESSSFN